MSKLYVGNLSSECNENALRQLFQDHNLSCTTILVKRGGYAFVDCADQSTADRAIDKLNGVSINVSAVEKSNGDDDADDDNDDNDDDGRAGGGNDGYGDGDITNLILQPRSTM
ncbi:hypothetical protein HZH68_015860 [Vespula germanica]|uniref:RRM domain-containing protein n=1 Tax=Vespula germanica TaxID=30212 RepID=A0A834MQ53_VESGE|nr:hypothetical protein HZH68_015860 [Vespula germanica]